MQTDPNNWKKPMEFDPHLHFLDENDQIKKTTSYGPFGFGRRICMGDQLAKNHMFLIASRLLQKVRVEKLPDVNYNLDCDPSMDMVMVPLPFHIRIVPRD